MMTTKDELPEEEANSRPRSPMEKALEDAESEKIRVSEAVWRGLEAVRRSGLTNMLDRPVVASIAEEFGFPETAYWVAHNRKNYSEGVFKGFVVEHDERKL